MKNFILLFLSCFALTWVGCEKEEIPSVTDQIPTTMLSGGEDSSVDLFAGNMEVLFGDDTYHSKSNTHSEDEHCCQLFPGQNPNNWEFDVPMVCNGLGPRMKKG